MNGDYAGAWPWSLHPQREANQARGRPVLVPTARSRAFVASREAIAFGLSQSVQSPPVGYIDEGPDQPYRRSLPRGPIPYHLNYEQVKGDVVALFRPVTPYATVPIVAPRGYWGETFPVEQPFVTYPHPSGLDDDVSLRGEGR
jgi:hypothetical protein